MAPKIDMKAASAAWNNGKKFAASPAAKAGIGEMQAHMAPTPRHSTAGFKP